MATRMGSTGRPVGLGEIVRERILSQLGRLRLRQWELAERLTTAGRVLVGPEYHVSRSSVTNAINGKVGIPIDEIDVWALALETSRAYLLGETWDPRPETPGTLAPSDDPG